MANTEPLFLKVCASKLYSLTNEQLLWEKDIPSMVYLFANH